jgi:uncharacterized membrane protein SpoIIM required for sporulation
LAAVDEFIAAHRPGWDELERLLGLAGRDPRRLRAEQIERLGWLYRHVASDLAQARRDFPREQVTRYLNDLAARAHPLLYRAPAGSWRRLARFFLADFPRRFRAAGPFVLAAFLLFALPALAAYLVALVNPAAAEEVLPATITRPVREGGLWTDFPQERRPLISTMIMTNNIQVAILAFAGGMLLGLLTVYVLVMNGVMLGAVFGYTQTYGLAGDLAAFVSPHGYVELSVVFMAGGAGLQMAWGVLSPGLYSRRDALGRAAQRAVLLLMGTVPLLVVAGLIEGFVSPSGLPNVAKYAIGPLTGLALYAFLWRGGRGLD